MVMKKNFGKHKKKLFKRTNNEDTKKVVKLPWISIIESKLRQAFKKKNVKTIFTSGSNLILLLCRSKTKLLSNSYSGSI